MSSQTLQNWILLIGVLINAATLVAVIVYVRATNGIKEAAIEQAKASNEQSEGLSKPVVTAEFVREVQDVRGHSKLRLRNIGNGPALSVSYTLVEEGGSSVPLLERQDAAYIEAGKEEERQESLPSEVFDLKPTSIGIVDLRC